MDPELKKSLEPRYRYKRASLSEGRYFILIRGVSRSTINLAVYEPFVERSPYFYDHERKALLKDGVKMADMELIPDPEWYRWTLPDGTEFHSYLQLHSENVLATSLTNWCRFMADGEGCKFCAISTGPGYVPKEPKKLAEILKRVEPQGDYVELNVNAGTVRNRDAGAELYIRFFNEIRKVSRIEIAAQIVPPADLHDIDRLKEAGVSSISFNLEVWNPAKRQEILPGKSRVPVEHYLGSLRHAVKLFGRNSVSSWLIGGLESPDTTLEGARVLASIGVIPFVTVFRPLIGSELEHLNPPDPDMMAHVFSGVRKIQLEYGLNPFEGESGCAKCNACAVILDS
jgi:radical SAM protein (TIGR04043 family)